MIHRSQFKLRTGSRSRSGVVFDTVIEELDDVEFVDRPRGKGDNPKTAVAEFVRTNSDLVVDNTTDEKFFDFDGSGWVFEASKVDA